MRKSPAVFVVLLAAAVASPSAFAQDADTFNFSGDSFDNQGTLQLAHPNIGQNGSFYAGLGLSLANDPLVIRYADGTEESLVTTQFGTRLHAGYNWNTKLRADIEVPFYVVGSPDEDIKGFALGDIRLGALVPIKRYETEGLGFALKPFLSLPTGSSSAYLKNGFGLGLIGALGGQKGALGWRANLGLDLSTKQTIAVDSETATIDELPLGSNLYLGAGVDYRVIEQLRLGVELTSQNDFAAGLGPWNASPLEGHVYGAYGTGSGLQATLGIGTGLRAGVGAPDWRAVVGISYRHPGGPPDTDLDGLADPVDSCVNDPEDFDSFEDADGCPDPDNDRDGILDTSDTCPMDPEDKDDYEDADGCPEPDNDGDGLLDADDRCPVKPGPGSTQGCPDNDNDGLANLDDECPDEPGPKETRGCPDRDNDRVPDKRDRCPDVAIDTRADPTRSDGCPARVIVTKEKIEILDVIYFDVNKTTIKKVSYPLLADIAKVLNDNPDLTKLEVAGHTDSDGKDSANLTLSQGRAEAVVKHLETIGGVAPGRLSPKGYGESVPKVPNDTPENKALNRRVEFVILERAEVGPPGTGTQVLEKPPGTP